MVETGEAKGPPFSPRRESHPTRELGRRGALSPSGTIATLISWVVDISPISMAESRAEWEAKMKDKHGDVSPAQLDAWWNMKQRAGTGSSSGGGANVALKNRNWPDPDEAVPGRVVSTKQYPVESTHGGGGE